MANRTIHVYTGHTLHISSIAKEDLPFRLTDDVEAFNKFWVVRNWDKDGVVFMYLGKGNVDAPKEIVAWYSTTGAFWSGFGTTLKSAVEGAMKDGWMYA